MTKLSMIDEYMVNNYATDKQRDYIELARKVGARGASRELGVGHTTVLTAMTRVINKAKDDGYIVGLPRIPVAPKQILGKNTIQINKDGEVERIWARVSDREQEVKDAIKHFCADLPRIEPKKPKSLKSYSKDIIPFFNIGDGHIGMLSYRYEVGADFDLSIAERDLMAAMKILIDESPTCERCVIQDMGDMTHYENFAGKTEASGHDLDCDGRYSKMLKVYVRVMRFIIETALSKFRHVDVIVNQGNHSRTNDLWMFELITNVYENEPRLHVLNNENVFIPYRMGNTFVMTHHSDKCRPNKLADVMATDYRHDFGEALYKYIDIGHIHHSMVLKEHPSVTIESFNQLATSDKYAHEGGWRSRSCLTVVYRSKTYGEVGRQKLPLERVRDIIEGVKAGTNPNKRTKVYTV